MFHPRFIMILKYPYRTYFQGEMFCFFRLKYNTNQEGRPKGKSHLTGMACGAVRQVCNKKQFLYCDSKLKKASTVVWYSWGKLRLTKASGTQETSN